MNKKIKDMKRIIIAALTIVAMVGCQKEDNDAPITSESKAISFSSEITTRVSGTNWESGDAVGIMVTKDNAFVTDYKYNAKHNVNISSSTTICGFTPESSEHTLYWPTDTTETIDFYGYYPYSALLSSEDESYPINVAVQSTPKAIDFMEASTRVSYPAGYSSSSNMSVALNFNRRMSKLTFVITAGDGLELSDITGVKLKGFYTKANYDFVNNEFTNLSSIADITAYKSGTNTYSVIVIPTMDGDRVYKPTSHTVVFTTTTGDIKWDITDVDLSAGAHRLYNVTVARTLLVSGGNEIAEWNTEDGGELEVE